MSHIKLSVLVFVCILLTACERHADLSNLEEYSRNGIRFTLPGNWNVTEDVEENRFRYLFVETSGDAIVVITIYPIESSIPLREYAERTIEGSVAEFPLGSRNEGTFAEINKSIAGQIYEGFKNEFVVSMAGIEVPHIATYYSFAAKSKAAYLSTQVASEDLSKVDQGFDLVISTFKIQ